MGWASGMEARRGGIFYSELRMHVYPMLSLARCVARPPSPTKFRQPLAKLPAQLSNTASNISAWLQNQSAPTTLPITHQRDPPARF